MKRIVFVSLMSGFMASVAFAAPAPILELLTEMRECGATVRGGYDKDLGVFIVGIGRTRYRPGAIEKSREIALLQAKESIAGALKRSVKAKETLFSEMSVVDDTTKVKLILTSMSETSINQLLQGEQVISSGKNENGEMEVVVYVSSKMTDYASDYHKVVGSSECKRGVKAVGIAADRHVAEQNALRSAVEQVAGTLVVGKISINEREELHKKLATSAGALVDEYRVVKETKVDAEFRVEVIAIVSKRKLYDTYKSYFKALDNPAFYIQSSNRALAQSFTQFFVEKGMQITENRDDAQYVIRLDGRYHDRETPGNSASMGTMLSLNIDIVSTDGARVLLKMNEKCAKDSEVLNRGQRMNEVSCMIFEKVHGRLHQAIHNMVVKMLDDQTVVE